MTPEKLAYDRWITPVVWFNVIKIEHRSFSSVFSVVSVLLHECLILRFFHGKEIASVPMRDARLIIYDGMRITGNKVYHTQHQMGIGQL